MIKLFFVFFIFITISIRPICAQSQDFQLSTSIAYNTKHFFGLKRNLRSSDKGLSKLDIKYDTNNSSSQISLNYDGNNITLDRSYLEYSSGIATFGVGAIERNWSFSNKTSLILSHNARPFKSIYLNLKHGFEYSWMPAKANWSLEIFNGFTNNSFNNGESMLTGIRTILSPIKGLDFELAQISQWGGKGNDNGISALGGALLFDTNSGSNSNINKMAGFGISYTIPTYTKPLRIYAQMIGEDEAGNLPSCYAYLAGLEWSNTNIKYPIIIGIETIDTRIDRTSNGYCGPNTMYNNNTYDYTNYGKTMGASVDTEGTSHGLYIRSQISQKMKIEFATKSVVINDNNWSEHRLSSDRQLGFVSSLGASWVKNKISFKGDIYNQSFNLDKADIKSGYGFIFSSSIKF